MKWKKWMKTNSSASVIDKALIAGHYVFSSKEFKNLYQEGKSILRKKKIDLDAIIRNELKRSIERYTLNLGIEG